MPRDERQLNEVLETLNDIKNSTDGVPLADKELRHVLKEIIAIERKYMYGDRNLSSAQRKDKVQEIVDQHFDNKKDGGQ